MLDERADKAADLAIRLQKQFGAVGNAKLPDLYVNAKQGLAQCVRVDECKSWADKAEAIRSYARQAGDDELMKTAMRIKGRAIERLGALLEDMERAGRLGRPKNGSGVGTISNSAKEAGLSKHQAHQAQAVARFARNEPARYESMVERRDPATVTDLAQQGRKPAHPPKTAHLKGVTPNEFARSTYAMGEIGRMVEVARKVAPAIVAQTATPTEVRRLLSETEFLARWVADLRKRLAP
jgi:hypothetical protein